MLSDLRAIKLLWQVTVKVCKHLLLFSDLILSWMGGVGQLAGFIGLWLIPMYHCFKIKEDSVRVTVFLVVSVEVII